MDTISGATQLNVRLTKKEQFLQDERKSAGWVPWPPSPPVRDLLADPSRADAATADVLPRSESPPVPSL